jgi:hypothetical protein
MIISPDEAVQLLGKWKSEGTPVSIALRTDRASMSFAGFITDVSHVRIRGGRFTPIGTKLAQFEVNLETAETFMYSEVREADEDIREQLSDRVPSLLSISSHEFQCIIVELTSMNTIALDV